MRYWLFGGIKLATLLSGSIGSAGCSVGSPSTASDRSVYLSGTIDDTMVRSLRNVNLSQIKLVRIASSGGKVSSALDIADTIRRYGLSVHVDGICLSACASIVLIAGKTRTFKEGSLIALHGSQIGLNLSFISIDRRRPGRYRQSETVKELSVREIKLYHEAGVDWHFLLLPYIKRGALCALEAKQADGSIAFATSTLSSAYAFSNGTAQQFGLKFEGDASKLNSIESWSSKISFDQMRSVSFDKNPPPVIDKSLLISQINSIVEC